MSTSLQEKKERFQLLLQQAMIPEDVIGQHLREGYIEKLILQKGSKKWIFHLRLDPFLPGSVYQLLQAKLKIAFAHLAQVEIHIRWTGSVEPARLFREYWPIFLTENQAQLNGLHKRLMEEPPIWEEENKLCFTLANEVEVNLWQKKLNEMLHRFYSQICDWNVQIRYRCQEEDVAYQQFREALEKEDESLASEVQIQLEHKTDKGERERQEVWLIGQPIREEAVQLKEIIEEERSIIVQGYIFDLEIRELKSGRSLLTFKMTDYSDSIIVKIFSRDKEDAALFQSVKKGIWVKVRGSVQMDTFLRDLVVMANDVNQIKVKEREDTSEEKRVELHLHTTMSAMDAVTPISNYVERAAKWGHQAIAVTDHAVAQAFPEAYSVSKKYGVKMIYGMEANLVDDGASIVYHPQERQLTEETYIIFDVETTGLSVVYNKIIELAAVKLVNGEVMDRFERFIDPHEPISAMISDLTGITDDMVRGAPEEDEVLHDFRAFIGDHTLVAHNASFDMGFLHMGYKKLGLKLNNPVIDTLELARFLYPELRNHRLNTLCKKFNIQLLNHHRAVYDAEATGQLLWKMINDCLKQGMTRLDQINEQKGPGDYQRARPSHCTIYAQNQEGLKNLYKLISAAHIEYFHRVPRIPRSLLQKHRQGLLVGSACDKGEVFEAMLQKSPEEVEQTAQFYDFLEIQPCSAYEHLIERELVKDKKQIEEILQNIVQLGKKIEKPVVATGNVHYLDPHDNVYRQILITTLGGATPLKPDQLPPVHFRTTSEMLEEFQFLGEADCRQVVIHNSIAIANQIEEIQPIPDALYTPTIAGADEEIRKTSYERAKSVYGDPLPALVEQRLEKELSSIIGHGFAVIYLISAKLVVKSLQDGYLVGSRGSVGSSFVATMTQITEVNPLPPHYVCPSCHYTQFFEDGSVGSGFDLPDQTCPQCGQHLKKDGHDIPFETFLGFEGDKVPDIDLNFSGDYQPIAHKYTQELFGSDNVFRAGTIGTVADKTAFGFVKKFEEEQQLVYRSAEVARLAAGCTGVRRTTGQHPGGIIVVPDDKEIYDFTPIQFPADDVQSEWRTTHFDFHSIHDNLLKLDILGHDDPTVIRMLQDLSHMDPKTIPTDDPEMMKIFSSTEPLGVTEEEIMSKTGTLGIPEFGTRFVRQMLEDTKPTTFAELVQISGLSHGTDVWLNNAQDLIRNETAVLSEVISTRDDIMVYLIHQGLDPSRAFAIMEKVRKGKGVSEEDIAYMREHHVPDWYIDSCQKIKYMFPKAHAVAYVLMAVRIAYFKVHHPIFFYASYFTVRADDFDVSLAIRGYAAIRKKIEEIISKGNDAQPKEKSLLTVLELCLEMVSRGFSFQKVDIYRSHATQFLVDGDSLIPPFNALPGVGTNAAINIAKAREQGPFLSIEDLQNRSRITKTVVEFLAEQGCLDELPETNQLSLF